jgi:23S rRNA pseudouridine955/2504/2580 synthase/23S rRNA pseudouridine1911/1915/1917 synthase
MSLFHFLRRTLPRSMGRDVLGLIVDGRVMVNGEAGDVQMPLRTGDFIEVDLDAIENGPRGKGAGKKGAGEKGNATLDILYRDDALICVDKPAGIPVIPDRRPKGPTAVEICRAMLAPEGLRPRPVHRLDKYTSGVLMLALTKKATQPLGELFEERRVSKVYLAVVRGVPFPREGVVDAPIGPDRRKVSRMVVDPAGGKTAVSRYRTLNAWRGYALVEVRPETGRTHQIRVHLAHIKNPILCDPLYGGGEAFHLSTIKPDYRIGRGKRERPIIKRLALHAAELAFTSPATGREVVVRSPMPQDLEILRQKIDKFAGPE